MRENLGKDQQTEAFMKLARAQKTGQFWVEKNLLLVKAHRVYVPKPENLKRML